MFLNLKQIGDEDRINICIMNSDHQAADGNPTDMMMKKKYSFSIDNMMLD